MDIYEISQFKKGSIFFKRFWSTERCLRKPFVYSVFDSLYFRIKNKLAVSDYFAMELYKKEYEKNYKLDFLGYGAYKNLMYKICPEKNRGIVNNKYITKLVLQDSGIKTPKTYGLLKIGPKIHEGKINLSSFVDLVDLLDSLKVKSCVLKPCVDTRGGSGIKFVFKNKIKNLLNENIKKEYIIDINNGEEEFLNKISHKKVYLCEETVEQEESIKNINPYSINTIRFLVIKKGCMAELLGAFLRVSLGGVPVDNFSAGGMISRINLDTGKLEGFVYKNIFFEKAEIHPFTKKTVNGKSVPYWDDAVIIAKSAASSFPGLNFLGIDVALSTNGPVVIEVNGFPHYDSQYLIRLGYRKHFNECILRLQ